MKKRQWKLSTIIIIFVCMVVLISLVITSILIGNTVKNSIHKTAEEKAEAVSRTTAQSNIVKRGLKDKNKEQQIQRYASEIKSATDVSFIVVMDMNSTRKSHPNPDLIGKKFQGGDESPALKGKEIITESKGTLGKSLRSFTPIYDNGEQIGLVAVGIPIETVNEAFASGLRDIFIGLIIGMFFGIIGAYLLARYIKKILHGLEPAIIAKRLEERNTMLQSVHEGIVAVDREGKINLVNKSAAQIFKRAGLTEYPIGMKINEYLDSTQLHKVVEIGQPEVDEEQNINGVKILVNRVPLYVNNQIVGAISTFRDKTEISRLSEQLVGVKTYAETLRAQSHEFSNRLHVIMGMLQMENYEEVKQYIREVVRYSAQENVNIATQIKDAALAGFLIGKLSLAREKNIELTIHINEIVPEPHDSQLTHEIITVIGNLIDNSIDALANQKSKIIEVKLNYSQQNLKIDITDSGEGLTPHMQQKIFEKGYSTKGDNRGYGLYLINESVKKLKGSINVDKDSDGYTKFIVEIPYE
ncbi:DcuS/MalK family sensor histidine kinase [Staphylococcus pseudoxylosus]|uniref:DcuS/MalK family sensor histidine kinase n=1 Tax=Staphylococcus pseudoxylosus TaxID=2282419 RepID=UPI00298EEEDF|nr:DcuS/MalK family sensor histidine kinase [Staphylococcus pseudoxylosus]MDW8545936.1 DcuS/MalK family sensor histidine kinase [Staphylococcus pseudoxylosus]